MTATNLHKKSEIDSGIYLATRIDKLRETLAGLEQQQAKFIQSNKQVITDSLAPFIKQKDELLEELTKLEEQRAKLQEPLDNEWQRVHAKQDTLIKYENELRQSKFIYEKRFRETQDKFTEYQSLIKKFKGLVEDSEELLKIAQQRDEESNQSKLLADELIRKSEYDCKQQMQNMVMKERKLEYDRKHYKDFLANLRVREKKLVLREKKLLIQERKL